MKGFKLLFLLLTFKIITFITVVVCSQQNILKKEQPLTHNWVLFNEEDYDGVSYPHINFAFGWNIITIDDSLRIRFVVNCKTDSETSFVGHGISPSGGMKGADVVVLRNKDGEYTLEDRFATAFAEPLVDDVQNVELIEAFHQNGVTSFIYERDVESCDGAQDQSINQHGYSKVIFSFGEDVADNIQYHGATNRGNTYVDFFGAMGTEDPETWLPADTVVATLTTPIYTPPQDTDTTYACSLHSQKIPLDKKYHGVKISPIIRSPLVHHMILYDCSGVNVPPELNDSNVLSCDDLDMCSLIFHGWAVGAPATYAPPGLGIPFGFINDATQNITIGENLILEVHYDNPNYESITDLGSGFEITYTETLREQDIGILMLGILPVNWAPQIPAGESDYAIEADCPNMCLSTRIGQNITVFEGFIHMHLVGSRGTVHHIQAGKETTPIFKEDWYDFNYQGANIPIGGARVISSNDALRLTCYYNTMSRTTATEMGPKTSDEMCLAFLTYYPRSPNLMACMDITQNPYNFPGVYGCSDGRIDTSSYGDIDDFIDHVVISNEKEVQGFTPLEVNDSVCDLTGDDKDEDNNNDGGNSKELLAIILPVIFGTICLCILVIIGCLVVTAIIAVIIVGLLTKIGVNLFRSHDNSAFELSSTTNTIESSEGW